MKIYYDRIPENDTSYWLGIMVRLWAMFFSFSIWKTHFESQCYNFSQKNKNVALCLISYYSIQKRTYWVFLSVLWWYWGLIRCFLCDVANPLELPAIWCRDSMMGASSYPAASLTLQCTVCSMLLIEGTLAKRLRTFLAHVSSQDGVWVGGREGNRGLFPPVPSIYPV